MTGFGKAEARDKNVRVAVEISSINKKGLEISVNLPRDLLSLEIELREMLQKELARGRVIINVTLQQLKSSDTPQLPIHYDVMENHYRTLRTLARKLGCSENLELSFLLTLPGVMVLEKNSNHVQSTKEMVSKTAARAIAVLKQSREREGKYLSRQLLKNVQTIERHVNAIAKANPSLLKYYRETLIKRMESAGVSIDSNDERVLKEVAFFADRCDVTEEITRIRAHLKEAKRLLQSEQSVGRNLDFLIQELHREVNTTGSKSNGLEISRHVIALKAELEKIREQVQNFE